MRACVHTTASRHVQQPAMFSSPRLTASIFTDIWVLPSPSPSRHAPEIRNIIIVPENSSDEDYFSLLSDVAKRRAPLVRAFRVKLILLAWKSTSGDTLIICVKTLSFNISYYASLQSCHASWRALPFITMPLIIITREFNDMLLALLGFGWDGRFV